MCTAIKRRTLAGRNLDVTRTYGEEIVITPKKYSISLRREENLKEHYAFVGMGTVERGFPLYFDAVNECGLYAAGLNYVKNACYLPKKEGKLNLAPFELIPYLLASCRSVSEAKAVLAEINLTDIPFSREIENAELHWMIADKERAITVEPDENGLNIYDNPVGVLTNNPNFPYQLFRLNDYSSLSPRQPSNPVSQNYRPELYSEGMGAIGLPGDLSSTSRFIRARFHTENSKGDGVTDLFHLLASVAMPDGSVRVGDAYERTEYSTVADLEAADYYYRPYDGAGIVTVSLSRANTDGSTLERYPIVRTAPMAQN